MELHEIIREMERQYYSDLALMVVLIFSILLAYKNRKKFKVLRYMPIYLIWLLIDMLLNSMCLRPNSLLFYIIPYAQWVDYFSTLVELIIFSNFFYCLIKNYILKKGIIAINIVFAFYFIYMGVIDENTYYGVTEATQSKVYTLEAVLLLLICLTYFFQLFKELPFSNAKDEPVFWVSAGILLFMTCTLPYSVLENYISIKYHHFSFSLYSIFYIFYIFLCFMIVRAYLCKAKVATSQV